MPVAVIALAAGSFAAGASAFAAAGTLAGMVAAGATMVGAAMTIVGTITKNPKIVKIGAILGIVGSLGTMAINSMAAGASAASAGAAEGAAAGATEAASGAAGSVADVAGEAVTQGIPQPFVDALKDTGAGAVDTAAKAAEAGAKSGGMLDTARAVATEGAGQAATDTLGQSLANPASTFNAGADVLKINPADIAKPIGIDAFAVPNVAGAPPGMLGTMSAWAKANPELAKMAMNGVAGVAGNVAPSAKDKAMMDAYRAQTAQSAEQTALLKRRALWGSGRI